jgi:hypothetical protein
MGRWGEFELLVVRAVYSPLRWSPRSQEKGRYHSSFADPHGALLVRTVVPFAIRTRVKAAQRNLNECVALISPMRSALVNIGRHIITVPASAIAN